MMRTIEVVELARAGRFAEIARWFAPALRAAVSADALKVAWGNEIGEVHTVGEPTTEPIKDDLVRVSVPVTGERGAVTVITAVDENGTLHGFRLAAATAEWTPPSYADPTKFTERDVQVGTQPGALTLPHGERRPPGVVLLSGMGRFDRDGTAGPNKMMKDLAWGLASRGIAVVRFDKPTDTATATEEYVPTAVAAVRLLHEHSDRVFVLGHSMGAKISPKVAVAEPSVAGLVIMAGDTQPMPTAAVRTARHVVAHDPSPAADAFLQLVTQQAARTESPDLSTKTPASELLFGLPATYWLDMREYDQVATASTVDRPILILQGGRDYQVTPEHDFEGWRTGLAHRDDVTTRIYDADDHMFYPGTGPSKPSDYQATHHVDVEVIADIADWLRR